MTEPTLLLHLDWIQFQVKWLSKLDACFHRIYSPTKLNFSTRHFKEVWEFYLSGKRIATLTAKPHSGILDPDVMLVKFDNWVCYSSHMRTYIREFLEYNGLEFICFSRLDVCADFNHLYNNLKPQAFIKNYLKRRYLRLGKSNNIALHFSQKTHEHVAKGLKFGSNTSEATAYIYNKTLEMNSIIWKPHIYESWVSGGLDVSQDVWRIEISLKSGGILKCDTNTGEVDLFLSLRVIEYEYICKAFCNLCARYFTFVYNDGQIRRDRMKVLRLFSNQFTTEILVHGERLRDASRSDKIFIKKLHELNNELRGRDFFMNVYMTKFEEELIEKSHLQTWAMYHGLNKP